MLRTFLIKLLILYCCMVIYQSSPVPKKAGKCGYESCDLGKPGMINVHLVAHTHDDVGWLKTVDQYFYGYKNNIQKAGVGLIIDTVVQNLKVGGQKKFIYVEMAFFYRWWNEQSKETQELTKQLVNNGNLQFILGGWSMNDEAATHYTAIIDQHTLGLKFLKDNFGECGRPLVAWQIDPFGHSREQANLFAQMGYDGVYFMRLDYQDKDNRRSKKELEMIWRGQDSSPGADLFTGILNNTYCPPGGFCFDIECQDDPIMDDKRMHDYNVKKRIDDFLEYAKYQAKYYTTNHIMIPMGCDFQYQSARMWYLNLDKLIKYANARQVNGSKFNLMYSTPSCYTYAVNQANSKYAAPKTDDFFPYADSSNSFWTGYFTSRAALKYMVRTSNAFLQAVKQLSVFSKISPASVQPNIDLLRRPMGVLQHHDAVSGTEKQEVAYDYAQRLSEGLVPALKAAQQSLAAITGISNDFVVCPLLNTSSCNFTLHQKVFNVVLYNPGSQSQNHWLRLPIANNGVDYQIHDPSGKDIPFAVMKVSPRTMEIPEGSKTRGEYEIVFKATIPALGYNYYSINASPSTTLKMSLPPFFSPMTETGSAVFSNGIVSLTFDILSGMLLSMTNKYKAAMPLQTSLKYYTGYQGKGRPSGAYVFRPNEVTANGWSTAKLTVQKNALVTEIYQNFTSWVTLVYRLYANADYVELEWTVGPIPDSDNVGREVILHYKTPFQTTNCYTDANGRQLLKRELNHRATWNFVNSEPVSGNYYPINSRILIKDRLPGVDGLMQFVVLTDRSEGGGCPRSGEMEVMVHRRTMKDDSLGVGEPLKENGSDKKGLIIRGKHILYFGTDEQATEFHRQKAALEFMKPAILFSSNPTPTIKHQQWSALKVSLPPNVQLLTLENWDAGSHLIRFEHLYQYGEHPTLSQPVTIDISKLFVNLSIKKMEMMTLAANQKINDSRRLQWTTTEGQARTAGSGAQLSGAVLTLQPMAIATLVIS